MLFFCIFENILLQFNFYITSSLIKNLFLDKIYFLHAKLIQWKWDLYFHNPSKPILSAGMVYLPSEDKVLTQVRFKYF